MRGVRTPKPYLWLNDALFRYPIPCVSLELSLIQIIRQSKFCDGCEWGWSAWICIVAGLLWLCSAAALWYMPGESDGPDEMMPAPADASDPSPTDKKEEEE